MKLSTLLLQWGPRKDMSPQLLASSRSLGVDVPNHTNYATNYALPKYMPAIDGLRAFAVLAVLIVHFPWMPSSRHVLLNRLHVQPVSQYGWVGVDLFFVISGFLITGILLDSKDSPHYFRNFFARRALRIWPLYYAVVCFVFVIYSRIHPQGSVAEHLTGWPYYVSYLQNFVFFDNGVPLLAVTWSLAVEEQFYMTWPFVIFLCGRKRLRGILMALLLGSPIIRLVLNHYVGGHYPMITFGRMDGIVAGSLLALWFRSETFSLARLRKWASRFLVVGGIGSVYFLTTSRNAGQQSIWVYCFLAVAFSGLLCFAAVDSLLPRPVYKLLTNSALSYVGKISYGLYLLHPIAYYTYNFLIHNLRLSLAADTFGQDVVAFVGELGLAFLFASGSWYFFEQPILRLKKKFLPKVTTSRYTLQSSELTT